MENLLADKIAVITGAGGGIGRATAEMLAKKQVKLALLGGNNLANLQETCDLVRQHTECIMLPGDLTQEDFIKESINKVIEVFNNIDVVINNAGVAQSTPFEEITLQEFDKIMAINLKVPFMLTQAALPYLKKSDAATIINIASVVSHAGYPLQSIYTASKHALLGMTKSLAAELYKENIRIHAISPGGVYTNMVKISRPDLTGEGMIQPEEVAEIIEFLLTHRGNAVIDEILLHRVNKQPFLV
ncbi:MAG: SDR family oxidoreductase [Lentisphaeria bacterium]|nr:SDR family oxidoreductase [Lentisphaeria bacterium]